MKYRLPYSLVFIGFSYFIMLGLLRPFLLETAVQTPFFTTRLFACQQLEQKPVGWLLYIGALLEQSMAWPWLGASLLVAILVSIAYATRWVMHIGNAWFGLCYILPFALLVNYTRQGYLIYIEKTHGMAFALPIGILLILLLTGSILRLFKIKWILSGKNKLWMAYVTAVFFIAACIGAFHFSFRDTNFLSILRMKQAAEQGGWEQVLTLARNNTKEPTRLQVCLTRLALFKTGRMGDELFTYPDGDANYNAPISQPWMRLIGAPVLYLNYGKSGFAYRWAMEDMVEYGERPSSLQTMLQVARLNGEEALTCRYERALGNTMFFKPKPRDEAWEPDLKQLMNYTDQLDGDDGLVEFYLLQSFSLTEGGSRQLVELSLMSRMISKNLNGFWPRFMALLPLWQQEGHIPIHYQEAALLVSQLQGGMDTTTMPISTNVRQQFQHLIEASAQMGDSPAARDALRNEFQGTYWYYYFFVDGLKTT